MLLKIDRRVTTCLAFLCHTPFCLQTLSVLMYIISVLCSFAGAKLMQKRPENNTDRHEPNPGAFQPPSSFSFHLALPLFIRPLPPSCFPFWLEAATFILTHLTFYSSHSLIFLLKNKLKTPEREEKKNTQFKAMCFTWNTLQKENFW